jgi:two-component system, chemotaxis family, sensor kinase CheA
LTEDIVSVDNEFLQDPAMIQEFLTESEELLQGMDQDMITLESTPGDAELLNQIFRALHTIKGTAGFLNFAPVVRLGHRAEDVLNVLRRGELRLTRRITDALLAARDQLGQMLSDIRQGGLKTYDLDALLEELEAAQKPEGPPPRLGDILVAEGVIEQKDLESVLEEQAALPRGLKLGELLVKKGLASTADVGNALASQNASASREDAAVGGQTVRVDSAKLDELINLIGELVLERNRLSQLTRDLTSGRIAADVLHPAFDQSAARLSFVTEELQRACLKTRMVPIDMVFRKFPRLVRDVAGSLQKEAELQVKGQGTEIDKTMVELLGDPLVHLVRNSLDHGLEMPGVRESQGKPRKGMIRLEARQEGDQIVISIADDGAGIDPERVLRKAVEKGLLTVDRGRQLAPREILDFIFLPGFSTVEKVSNLSGRGVGMDVVRSNLKRMNGSIQLESTVGMGTTILLRLPLTLAILQVLLVQVSDEIYALPLRSVLETSRIRKEEVHLVEGMEVLRLRDETLPLLRLRKMFATQEALNATGSENVVVLSIGEKRIALMVDRLIGQESTVIKPLGSYLHNCTSIGGATVGGDGRVRLVLDPAGLLASAHGPGARETVQ